MSKTNSRAFDFPGKALLCLEFKGETCRENPRGNRFCRGNFLDAASFEGVLK